MEKGLNLVLDNLVKNQDVTGVVVSDTQGLCLGVRGNASEDSSGLWKALLAEASKLEPDQPPPTLQLENSNKQCLVQGNSNIVVSVYRSRN